VKIWLVGLNFNPNPTPTAKAGIVHFNLNRPYSLDFESDMEVGKLFQQNALHALSGLSMRGIPFPEVFFAFFG